MVKNKDAICSNFDIVEDGSNTKAKKVNCLGCSTYISARSNRLKVYLTECSASDTWGYHQK